MAKAKVEPGDVVLVPLGEGDHAIAKVLFVSEYYKDVIVLGVSTAGTVKKVEAPSVLPTTYDLKVCTGAMYVGKKWPKVAHDTRPIDPEDTKRVVAGAVVVGDEKVGVATPEDGKRLPQQVILPEAAAVKRIKKALYG
jgi:hypothetical protein